jgi:hypothetical protein
VNKGGGSGAGGRIGTRYRCGMSDSYSSKLRFSRSQTQSLRKDIDWKVVEAPGRSTGKKQKSR